MKVSFGLRFLIFLFVILASFSFVSAGIEYYTEPYVVFVNDTSESIRFEASVNVNYTFEYGLNFSYGAEISSSFLNSSHEFMITGLESGATYYYKLKIYNDTDSNETFCSNFTTSDSGKKVFKFIVMGDARASDNQDGINDSIFSEILGLVKNENPDFVIMTGDIIHMGSDNYTVARNVWKEFTDIAKRITHYIPFFNAIGNHERISGSHALRRYREVWMHPHNGDGQTNYYDETTFWIEYGNSLFIFLNTEEPLYVSQIQGNQKAWLEQTLQKEGYNNKFVFCHRPLRGTNRTGSLYKTNKTNSDEIDAMFRQYNVTAAFYGNEHYYCRHHSGAWSNETVLENTESIIYSLEIGDGRNDGVNRIYAGLSDSNLYELSFDRGKGNFTKSIIYVASNSIRSLYFGDGRNDGVNRIYGTDYDNNVFEISWNGTGWENLTLGNGTIGEKMYDVVVGYGRNDSTNRVYSVSTDDRLYEFTWNGTCYRQAVAVRETGNLVSLDIGYGRNDSTNRVYTTSGGPGSVFEFTWNGTGWEKFTVWNALSQVNVLKLGDGRNDGTQRIYSGGYDNVLIEHTWNGTGWENLTLEPQGVNIWTIEIGDGRNDGVSRIYVGSEDGQISKYGWSKTADTYFEENFNLTSKRIRTIKIGKLREDILNRVYVGGYNFSVSEFNYLTEKRLYHIVSAGAGAPLYDPSSEDKLCWGEEKFAEYHYMRVEVSGGFVNFTAVNLSKIVRDNFFQMRDITAPSISFNLSSTSFSVGDSVSYSCMFDDYEDSSPNVTVTGVDSSTSGNKVATCTVTDSSGNSNFSSISYVVNDVIEDVGRSSSVTVLSGEQMEKGYTKLLRKMQEIRFKFENKIHKIKLKNIANKIATITVSSNPVTFNLTVNKTKKLNLNNDSYYDLQVSLEDIGNNSATLNVKTINETVSKKLNDIEKVVEDVEVSEDESLANLMWLWILIIIIIILIILIIIIFKNRDSKKEILDEYSR